MTMTITNRTVTTEKRLALVETLRLLTQVRQWADSMHSHIQSGNITIKSMQVVADDLWATTEPRISAKLVEAGIRQDLSNRCKLLIDSLCWMKTGRTKENVMANLAGFSEDIANMLMKLTKGSHKAEEPVTAKPITEASKLVGKVYCLPHEINRKPCSLYRLGEDGIVYFRRLGHWRQSVHGTPEHVRAVEDGTLVLHPDYNDIHSGSVETPVVDESLKVSMGHVKELYDALVTAAGSMGFSTKGLIVHFVKETFYRVAFGGEIYAEDKCKFEVYRKFMKTLDQKKTLF